MATSEDAIVAHIEAHIENIDDAVKCLMPTKRIGKREGYDRRWQVYLLVLQRDVVRGLVAVLRAKEYRPAIVLSRCVFEYRIKAEYLLKNRKEAHRQFQLVPKRIHDDLSRLPAPDDWTKAQLVNEYLEWRRTAGTLGDDIHGDIGATKMALAIADDKKIDSDGAPYSPEEIHKYGIPSWIVHADGAGMVDVFPGWKNDDDWRIRDKTGLLDLGDVALQVLHTIFDHLRVVRMYFRLDFGPLEALARRSLEIREAVMLEWRRQGGM